MLIKVKNGELYQEWIEYYEKYYPEMIPAAQRTFAFIKSQKGEHLSVFVR